MKKYRNAGQVIEEAVNESRKTGKHTQLTLGKMLASEDGEEVKAVLWPQASELARRAAERGELSEGHAMMVHLALDTASYSRVREGGAKLEVNGEQATVAVVTKDGRLRHAASAHREVQTDAREH